jgi:hypothetical protein
MAVKGWLESIRKWVDDEEDLDEQGIAKPRSKWDDFLVAVAREVEASMQREMFTPPGGPTYVPREYVVFLNSEDDSEWQGEKREGLARGLHHVLSERAKELAGENEFQTRTLTIELRVDPALEKGKFRVQHVWDTEAQKTMVRPRKRTEAAKAPASVAVVTDQSDVDDEATVVRPRKEATPVFSISVRRDGPDGESPPAEIRSFYKNEITIGRGSRLVDVDLRLEGDLEVSRQHATLVKNSDGSFVLACKGANPILLETGKEIAVGETAEIKPGEKVSICSYELTVQ